MNTNTISEGSDQSGTSASRKRRNRRTRDDVEARLISAARNLFAERGYAAVTTREIARTADVSETLLFRYFTDKAQLFDVVVSKPFNELMEGFLRLGRNEPSQGDGAHQMFVAVYELLEQNRGLLNAAYMGRGETAEGRLPIVRGLEHFFEHAQLSQTRQNEGMDAGFDLRLGVRLAFGMIASAALLKEWLMADASYDSDQIVATLESMISKALGPLDRD